MKRSDPRSGVILVTVLWSIALLSALAMAASVTFRGFAGVMAVERNRVQGDALLSAGLETAAGIIDTLGDAPLWIRRRRSSLPPVRSASRLSDEGGRIDVGKAPAEVIAAMLRSVGASEPRRTMSPGVSLNDAIPAMRLARFATFVRPMAPPGRRQWCRRRRRNWRSHFPTCGSSSSFPECDRSGWQPLRRLRLYSAAKR